MGDSGSDARRAELVAAYDAAVAADDPDGMAAAALGLTELQAFGPVPGRLPAFLHNAYERSTGRRRVELAIAIARAWSYGASPERAEPFVAEALAAPETDGDPALLAAALDAQLLTKWGPEAFEERAAITQRLEDLVARVADPEVHMNAHLWRLVTALEALDIGAVRRQVRGLEALAEETGSERVRFFAASRRAMYALLVGDVDLAERALADTLAAGAAAGEPDTFALEHALTASIARQRDDRALAAVEAPVFEEYAALEGVPVVAAEGALIWLHAGEPDRAARLLRELAGDGFDGIADGVDWMFSIACLTEVAAWLGDRASCERAIATLAPYEGRGVVDAGAVKFHGIVDHYLAMAAQALGRSDDAERWLANAAAAYRRMGASWWLRRVESPTPAVAAVASGGAVLRPAGGGVWEVGQEGATGSIRELKGLHYLRLLLARPHLPIPARELSDAVAGHAGESVVQPSVEPALDRTALLAYRARLAEIDDDLDVGGDVARVERLEAEREAILAELRAAAGLGGRARVSGSSDERARVAVRKAIAAAIDRVRGVDASLGRLLEVTVSTGTVCCYEPDPDRPITWHL